MIYCENLTNRDLLRNAMPLVSLEHEQWKLIMRYMETATLEKSIKDVLETVLVNQSRIEVLNSYGIYYGDKYDEPVPQKSVEMTVI